MSFENNFMTLKNWCHLQILEKLHYLTTLQAEVRASNIYFDGRGCDDLGITLRQLLHLDQASLNLQPGFQFTGRDRW